MKATGKSASENHTSYAADVHWAHKDAPHFSLSRTLTLLVCKLLNTVPCSSNNLLTLIWIFLQQCDGFSGWGRLLISPVCAAKALNRHMDTHTDRDTQNPSNPLCTLVTADWQTSPFLTDGPLLVNQRSVAREQRMPCSNGGQSVGVCQWQGGVEVGCLCACVCLCVWSRREASEICVRQVHSMHRYYHTQINSQRERHGNGHRGHFHMQMCSSTNTQALKINQSIDHLHPSMKHSYKFATERCIQ